MLTVEEFEVIGDSQTWCDKKLRPITRIVSGSVKIEDVYHRFIVRMSITGDTEPSCQITPDFERLSNTMVKPVTINYPYKTIKDELNKYLVCQEINKLPSIVEFYAPSSHDNVSCVNMFIKNDDGVNVILSREVNSGYIIDQDNIKGFTKASNYKTEEEYMNYVLSTVGLTESHSCNASKGHRIFWTGKNLSDIRAMVNRYSLTPDFKIYYKSGDKDESKDAIRNFVSFHTQN